MRGAVLLAALALGLASCAGDGAKAGEPSVPDAPLLGTEWTLASMDFEGGFLVMSSAGPHPSLTLQETEGTTGASGFSGVNRFTGPVTVGPGDALAFGPLATTRMAGDRDKMRLEAAYLEHLSSASSYSIAGGKLTIGTGDGTLQFQAPAN